MTTPPTNPPGNKQPCILDCDSPSLPPTDAEKRQCGCASCVPVNPPGETPNAKLLLALREAGSTGLDLSPGDPLCAKAAEAIAQLERELAASRAEVKEYAEEICSMLEKMKEHVAANDALRARLTAAEQDSKRIDIIEKNLASVRVETDDGEAPIPPEFSIVVRGTGTIGRGPTLRAAADDALTVHRIRKEET